jgi:integrase
MKTNVQPNNKTKLNGKELAQVTGLSSRNIAHLLSFVEIQPYIITEIDIKGQSKLFVHFDAIPIIQSKYKEIKELYNSYAANPDFVHARTVAKLLNKSYNEIIHSIKFGKWANNLISIPKTTPPDPNHIDATEHYFIKKEAITENKYKTLKEIAERNLISIKTLRKYSSKGLLPQPEHLYGTALFNEEQVLAALPDLREFSAKNSYRKEDYSTFHLLNKEQQAVLMEYISFIKNGGIIEYNGYKSRKILSNVQKRTKKILVHLSSIFCLIISGRSGIEEDIIESNRNYAEDYPTNFNPNKFDIYSINRDDFLFINRHRKDTTLINYGHSIRSFYYYLLQKTEEEAVMDEKNYRLFLSFHLRVKNFLKQFPTSNYEIREDDINKRVKSFLTREQIVVVKDLILRNPRSREPLKEATIWMFCCKTGVRPEELPHIRLEHFLLDDNGYLKLNKRGWGILNIPASISKGGKSPSHKLYKTPICPETVNQINFYLSRVYRKQGPFNAKGQGYLFRPDYTSPERCYKIDGRFTFIKELKPLLSFLSVDQRRDFDLKASRRSMNNLIDGFDVDLSSSGITNRVQKVAADYQMRHREGEDIGEKHYTASISEDQFYQVLDKTISFPWDLNKLEAWEIKHGYKQLNLICFEPFVVQLVNNEATKHEERLKWIEERLKEIRSRPKELSLSEWISERNKLIKERDFLSSL